MTCAHTLQRAAHWRQATLLSTEAPLLYVITPTRGDGRGLLGLSRLGLALAVARVQCRWFIIESRSKTAPELEMPLRLLLSDVTQGGLVNATHLLKSGSAGSRGGLQKSHGLSHVYADWKARGQPPRALVFFADDDNWYRPAVFEHMAAWVAFVPLNAPVLATWPSSEISEVGCVSVGAQPLRTTGTAVGGTAATEARRFGHGFACTPSGTIRHFQDRRTGRRFELDWSEFALPMWLLVPTSFTQMAWYGRRDGRLMYLAKNWASGRSENRFLDAVLSVNHSAVNRSAVNHSAPCERHECDAWLRSLCVLDVESSCSKNVTNALVYKTSRWQTPELCGDRRR